MKKCLTIILLLLIFTLSIKSQELLDFGGNLDQNVSFQERGPGSAGTFAPLAYDSIRSLSELNTPGYADAYPWLSVDALRLYYTSGINTNKLMLAKRPNINSYFTVQGIVPLTGLSSPASYWLSENELNVYICTDYDLYYATRPDTSSAFSPTTIITLTGPSPDQIKSASLNDAQNELFIHSSTLGTLQYTRTSATSFSFVRKLTLPAGYLHAHGQLSKDELSICLGVFPGSPQALIYKLTRPTLADTFAVSTFQQIPDINDTMVLNGQPSSSANMDHIAFVRAATNSWSANDLYIASKDGIISVFDPNKTSLTLSVFPNPAKSSLHFEFNVLSNEIKNTLAIFNSQGSIIKQIEITSEKTEVDISGLSSGVYFYDISGHRDRFIVIH